MKQKNKFIRANNLLAAISKLDPNRFGMGLLFSKLVDLSHQHSSQHLECTSTSIDLVQPSGWNTPVYHVVDSSRFVHSTPRAAQDFRRCPRETWNTGVKTGSRPDQTRPVHLHRPLCSDVFHRSWFVPFRFVYHHYHRNWVLLSCSCLYIIFLFILEKMLDAS